MFDFFKSFKTKQRKPNDLPPTRDPYQAQGILTPWFKEFNRSVQPAFYEILRESIPAIDGAINRITTLDGILGIECEKDGLFNELNDFLQSVRVNDLEQGLQAAYCAQSGEMYEQGAGTIMVYLTPDGRDVSHVRGLDSCGVYFNRDDKGVLQAWYRPPKKNTIGGDGSAKIQQILQGTASGAPIINLLAQNGYKLLNPQFMIHALYAPESGNPYGVSIMRSMELVTKALVTIENAQLSVWRRFGDPSFVANLQSAARLDQTQIEVRQKKMATDLAAVVDAKGRGNSADFVTVTGKDDKLSISILGAEGQILEIEAPARHCLEQMVAKIGLPSWMLGYHWSTAERLAEAQGTIVLQESRTRFALRKPGLERIFEIMLRARGRTWKRGDWQVIQELPNLSDMVAQAQADFLRAQTQLMLRDSGAPVAVEARRAQPDVASPAKAKPTDKATQSCQHKTADDMGEPWADPEPQLPLIEGNLQKALKKEWSILRDNVIAQLKPTAKTVSEFIFDADQLAQLLALANDFVQKSEPQLLAALAAVIPLAEKRAAEELAAVVAHSQQTADEIYRRATAQLKNTTARVYQQEIVGALASGVYDGMPQDSIVKMLKKIFDDKSYNYERLASTEMTMAHADAKIGSYETMELEMYDWVCSPATSCPQCTGYAASGPYKVGNSVLPGHDSHPFCGCTIAPHII